MASRGVRWFPARMDDVRDLEAAVEVAHARSLPPRRHNLHRVPQYDGEYTDNETGNQYLRARYYDPATGQFLSADPIESKTPTGTPAMPR